MAIKETENINPTILDFKLLVFLLDNGWEQQMLVLSFLLIVIPIIISPKK